jgi:multiple sugar transport system substrate-binding protein
MLMRKPISRRNFLKSMGALGLGAGLANALPTFGSPFMQSTNMRLWWWADEPGFSAWIDDTVRRFTEANAGVSIETLQMDVSAVITQFVTAAAAGEPPDIQFLWNGLYHMENVWLGYLEPLNSYIPEDVLRDSNATAMSLYDGNQYRVGWYPVPLLLEYNKDVWDSAGLDADNPPTTWDAWMGACETLKTAGVVPFGGGASDGFWGEWYFTLMLTQALNSGGEGIELFIGERDFREPQYWAYWARLEEMVSAGYLNDDILSVDLFSALGKVLTGEIATTINVGAVLPSHIAELGDRIGMMIMPVYADGAMSGKPISDTQGFGIPSGSQNKDAAAQFLIHTQSQESLNAMWELTRYFPANKTWDPSPIDDPTLRQLYDGWVGADTELWLSVLMPTMFWTDALFVSAQEVLAGNMTGEQAGEQNASIVQQWRALNSDLIPNYQTFAASIASATT